jgi:serine/threonine protein kinase
MADLQASDPREVGPYRLLSRIGVGGMGVVYLAVDGSGQRVALKLIRTESVGDVGFRGRFRREVEAAQRVGGICNARYIDADLDSDHPYLVTDYVEGGNLLDFVSANGPVAGDQLIGLAVGLAEGLVAMGAVGVFHRDLKPTNVLMSPSGPKVVDFGISHAADGTAITLTGNIVGSPGWMAPEQALGKGTTAAVDVFAWGATVAFASTGRSPFGEGRPDAVLYRIVHEAPDLEGLDPRLGPSVTRALQKDPLARPTADQLLVDLVKTAMAGSLPLGGSIAMATVVLDRTWHQGLPDSTDVGPVPHSPDRRRRRGWIAVAAFVLIAALIAGGVFAVGRSDNKTLADDSTTTTHTVGVASAATATSAAATNTTTQSSPTALESATLPLVACPTSYGVDPSPSPAALPSSTTESVPADLATQLTMYTDEQGDMKLLAPTGWVCNANFGADGSGGVTITPTGETLPSGQLSQGSTVEAIVGSETSACVQCREGQACPLFATAAADYEQDYQMTCPSEKPGEESSEPIEDGVVGFLDPPGVAGDAYPSGGAYPANGVMTYHSGNENGSWLDTCTLPYSQQALCTAVLNSFANTYGSE